MKPTENDRVCPGEVQTKPTNVRREQKNVDTWIVVELAHKLLPLCRLDAAVQPHVSHTRHVCLEQIVFDNVQHRLELAKDESTM